MTDETPRTVLDRLREDLAFAAPEVHWLHIERRFEEAVDEARHAALAEVRRGVAGLPTIVMAYPPDDPIHRAAVLAILDAAETP